MCFKNIYICVCVCMCVCVYEFTNWGYLERLGKVISCCWGSYPLDLYGLTMGTHGKNKVQKYSNLFSIDAS